MAPNIELLVAARVAQGLAGAMMMPQVLAITQNIFPPEERGAAFSLFGLSASLAAVTGPLLGGILISADLFGLDWRPIFLINVPIGLFAIVAGLRLIPPIPGNAGMTNDFVGIAIACIALFLLVYPLIEGRNYDWPLWVFAMMIAALPAAFAFVLWEGWRERQGRSQLLPISLMRNGGYVLGVVMAMAFFSGIPGFFMIFALFLQTGFGFTPLESGLTTMPFPIGIFTASLISNRMGPNFLRLRLILGSLILLGGMIFARQTVLDVGDAVDHWAFVAPLVIAGFGMGLTIAVLFQAILTNVDPRDTGSGSGALQAFQQMGGAIGVALIGEIFFAILASSDGPPEHADFVSAISHAMIYNIAIFIAFAIMALFLSTPTHRDGARSGRQKSAKVAEA
jgi:MFS family permease